MVVNLGFWVVVVEDLVEEGSLVVLIGIFEVVVFGLVGVVVVLGFGVMVGVFVLVLMGVVIFVEVVIEVDVVLVYKFILFGLLYYWLGVFI